MNLRKPPGSQDLVKHGYYLPLGILSEVFTSLRFVSNASPGPGQHLNFCFSCYCSNPSFTYCCCHCRRLSFTQFSFCGLPFHRLIYLMHWMNPQVSFQQHRIHSFSAEAFLPDLHNRSKWTGTAGVPNCCFPPVANELKGTSQNFSVSTEVLLNVHASTFACLLCGKNCKRLQMRRERHSPVEI